MYLNGYNSTINSAVAFEGKTAGKVVEESSAVAFVDKPYNTTCIRRIDTMPNSAKELQRDAERQDQEQQVSF